MNISGLVETVMTVIFLLVLLSYYALLFVRSKKYSIEKKFDSITIIIPALNEEKYIESAINSVVKAYGKKQIIVVNDASTDNTAKLIEPYKKKGIKIITNKKQRGKSFSLNLALKYATGDVVAIVDGDSYIKRDSLIRSLREVSRKNVAATCGVIKVKNRNKFICMWLHIELVYNSLIRSLFAKLNANVVTPGALSVYRRKELMDIGGFSTEGFSEDVDVAIRLIRKGYKISFDEKIVSETNMPYDIKGFLRQRTRLARGLINLLKRHMQINSTIIDVYTLPLFLFTYVQSIIMGSLTIYKLVSGYMMYFASKGVYFSVGVLKFFFDWFSIIGFIKWTYSIILGTTPLSLLSAVGVFSTLLSYPLFFYAIFKYDKRFDMRHLIPIFFMFPYWLVIMVIYTLCLPEIFRKSQYNIWKKN